jgi:hypothetical protein
MARKKSKPARHAAEQAADRHPHFAGHRTGGHDVAAAHHANTSPRPGQVAFSADQEAAMRNSAVPPAEPDADDVGAGAGASMAPDNDAGDMV